MVEPMDPTVPDIPLLITDGIPLFFAALIASSALVGAILGRRWAASRRRRSMNDALDEMGGDGAISREPLWTAAARLHDFIVLEGTIEGTLIQKMGGAHRSFPAQRQGRYAFIRDLHGERVDLSGEANILAGSFERFGLIDGRGLFSVCERRLVDGDRVIIKGKLRELDRCVGDDEGVTYRTASKRRFALAPATGRDELLIASRSLCKKADRARLTLLATVPFALIAGLIFAGVHWAVAKAATNQAWSIAIKADGDLRHAKRAMWWGSIGATSLDDRDWALNAISLATSMQSVTDPATQGDYALLSARFHRFRYHSCTEPLEILQSRGHDPTTIRVAEDCGDSSSAQVAAHAHMRSGDFWPASTLLATRWSRERRTKEALLLEFRAHLLAGRLELARDALSEIASRSAEFYGAEPRARRDIQHWLPCVEHVLDARIAARRNTDTQESLAEVAEEKLVHVIYDRATSEEARGICSLLFADLRDGGARDELLRNYVDGPQSWDRAVRKYAEHDWLGLEAEPARGNARGPYAPGDTHVVATSAPLGAHTFGAGTDPTEWRALDALAALSQPSREQRVVRMKLAADLARVAAVVGLESKALAWVDMLAADAVALHDQRIVAYYGDAAKLEPYTMERIELLRAFVHLRVALNRGDPQISRGATLPKRLVAFRTHDPETQRAQHELDAIVAYVEHGDLDGLNTPVGIPTSFTNHRATTHLVSAGLAAAEAGSGMALVQWLDTVSPSIALPVALLASRRITSGHEVMLAWLVDRSARDFASGQPSDSLYERAAIAYIRAGIAENLRAGEVARRFRDQNSRILYALMRRETSLVVGLTQAWE